MSLTRFPVSRIAIAVALKVCGVSPVVLALACAGATAGGWSVSLAAEGEVPVSRSATDGRAQWLTIRRDTCVDDGQVSYEADGRAHWIGASLNHCVSSPASVVLSSLRLARATEQLHEAPAQRRADFPAVFRPTALGAPEPAAAANPLPSSQIEQQPASSSELQAEPPPKPSPTPSPQQSHPGVTLRDPYAYAPRSPDIESGVDVLRRWLGSLDLHVNPQAWPCLDATALRENIRAQLEVLVSTEAAGVALDRESQSRKGNLRWLLDTMAIRSDDPASLQEGVSREWSVVWLDCGPDGVHLPSLLSPLYERLDGTLQMPVDIELAAVPLPLPLPGIPPAGLPAPSLPDIDLGAKASESGSEPGPGLFVIDDAIPAGFEALAEPQVVWVDVWFNGRNVGATEITATAEEVIFSAPSEVVAMLDSVEDPESMVEFLASPLATNAHKLCFGRNDPLGCGRVDAEPVALIYDENALRVDLFLAAALQSLQSLEGLRFLEPPESRNSSILSLGAVVTDLESEGSQVDLSAKALASYGRGHVSTDVDYTSRTEQARLRELKLTHFIEGHELNVGTYGWNPGGAWTSIDLLGVGFATSYKTRLDIEQAFSTELIVFLQEQSVVQLLVDDRVYTGDSYAPGNQVLDTRALPDGSYTVEIRIIESGGTERSETRTFTKSTRIPPKGETVFSATAGLPLRFREQGFAPETSEPPVAGFSVSHRVNDQSAARLGMLQLGERSFLQGDYIFLGKTFSFQAQASVGEDTTTAASLLATYDTRHGSFSINADHFETGIDLDVDLGADDLALELFTAERTQWTLGATRPLGDMTLRGSVSRRRSTTDGVLDSDRTEYRLNVRKPLFRSRYLRGFLEAGWQRDSQRDLATIQLDMFFDQPNHSARLGADLRKNGQDPWQAGVTANVGYRDSRDSFDWGANAYARASNSERAGARVFVEHPLYRASAATDLDFGESGEISRSSIATAAAHIGFDSKGAAVGGSEFSQAGVIIAVKGEPAGAAYDVIVNGLRKSRGEIGSTQFVGLQPFESYAVKIVPRNVLSNGIGNDVFEFTLYPGTVERIEIVAERQILLIATLVDEQGEPMGNAVVELEGNPMVTDADGILQAELSPGRVMSVTGLEGQSCVFTVPDAPDGEEVYVLEEPLVCVATGLVALGD